MHQVPHQRIQKEISSVSGIIAAALGMRNGDDTTQGTIRKPLIDPARYEQRNLTGTEASRYDQSNLIGGISFGRLEGLEVEVFNGGS